MPIPYPVPHKFRFNARHDYDSMGWVLNCYWDGGHFHFNVPGCRSNEETREAVRHFLMIKARQIADDESLDETSPQQVAVRADEIMEEFLRSLNCSQIST